ncbi:MAG: thioredoxin family protein [Oligoflexales bacterium]|nr:thioredoxin family protein [Oligoflexales bacterium]
MNPLKPLLEKLSASALSACWLLFLPSCTTDKNPQKTDAVVSDPVHEVAWHKGDVESAFIKAKNEHKKLFLYWGAKWCPPCNSLKARVFSKPRFKELMKHFVPIYLDGDTEMAQIWADRLQAYGYPTVIVFNPDGTEIMRISEGVDIAEFETAINSVLQESETSMQLITKCLDGGASDSDWKTLTYISWEQIPGKVLSDTKKLEQLGRLVEMMPPRLEKERALLTAGLVALAADLSEEGVSPEISRIIKKNPEKYLDGIFLSNETIKSCRNFIGYNSAGTLKWLFPDRRSSGYKKYREKFLAAAAFLADSGYESLDVRLLGFQPQLAIYRLEHGDSAKIPDMLRQKVIETVEEIDRSAKSSYERHSTISMSARILREAGEVERARKLLVRESRDTDTPWYYYSSLSVLEQKEGNREEAAKWAEAAKNSAKGNSTKIQWIVEELSLTVELFGKERQDRVYKLLEEYYALATSLPDGFSGRNKNRADTVSKRVKSLGRDKRLDSLVSANQKKCMELKGKNRDLCIGHFSDIQRL